MYSKKLKKQIISEYLIGGLSLCQIAKKSTPYYWIYKQYGKEKVKKF